MPVEVERAYPTPISNSPLLPLLLLSLLKQRHSPNGSLRIKKEYDYVIVGGGTAGAVVASRLSEKRCVSVLLLEAGPEPPLLTEVPALGRHFWFTDVDWKYKTAPQKHTGKSLVNRQIVFPSGKMLGGSSSLNGMWYIRGNRRDYDNWAAHGAKGWSFKDVFPYFLKLENNKDYKFLSDGYHTRGGPITVHQPRYESELKRALRDAAIGLGYKIVDSNAARQTGFYEHQATMREGQRCSTAKGYLVPAENRTNFDILPNARAKKIIIRHGKARGVRFAFRGYTYEVKARREVILSAGTINTAQLLMLSGIGPKRELQKLNIPVIEDLPVGQNLHDHGGTPVPYVLNSHISDFEEKISDPQNIKKYIHNRTGPLASTVGVNYLAFLKGQSRHPGGLPNYELFLAEMPTSIAKRHFGLKPEVYRKLYGPYENEPLFVCTVSVLQPKSRGSVTLRSKNPYEPPVIDPNYLADDRDVENLVQGMKTCERIAKSRPLWKLGATPFKTLIPGCEKYAYDDDKYFRCQARSIFVTLHDPVGTAKMGDPWDPTTVVDPKLKVKNIKGLRVVDSSVMPTVPSGSTNIPTIMLAEKASDIIKETIDCYKTDEKDWDEPEESSGWSDDDEYRDSWEDEEQWEKPQDKDAIWEDDEHWGKNKNEETTWIDEGESWKHPKETVWVDEEKWEDPKKTVWVDDDEDWKEPKTTTTTWVETPKKQWEVPKETIWVDGNVDDSWNKPKTTTKWVEHVYTDTPKQQWEVPKKESWVESGKKPITDYKPPVHISWSEGKDYSDNYEYKKSKDGKYSLKDFVTDPVKLSSILNSGYASYNYSKDTKPYYWPKKYSDSQNQQHTEPISSTWKEEKTEQNIPWTKTDTSQNWEEHDNHGVTKNVDELVKEAENDYYAKSYSTWTEPSIHSVTKSVDELVKLAEEGGYTQTHTSWRKPGNYKVTDDIEELIEQAKKESDKTITYTPWKTIK